MKISFVIPAYNEERYLADCLAATAAEIARHGRGIDTEIVVVNNASTDQTARVAQSFPGVRVVDEPQKGVAFARQRGLEAASGEIIAYIDADTRIEDGWLPLMLAAFAAEPDVVALSGPYVYYDFTGLWRSLAWPYQIVVGSITKFFTGQWVFGGNFAARRAALVAVGGFDTTIAFYGEDQNIVQRLKRVGKFKFLMRLTAKSSARRFVKEGVIRTVLVYALNFVSVAVFKHTPRMVAKDVR